MSAESSSAWRVISYLPVSSDWNTTTENELRQCCKRGPFDDGCTPGSQKMKILMFGPTQNGKSSLVNSLLGALTGKLKQYVLARESIHSVTRALHSPDIQVDGQSLNFLLTDMPGIHKSKGQYAEDYLKAVLNGHIKEDVEVPDGPLDPGAGYYIRHPQPLDRPCCVVLVMRAGKPVSQDTKNMLQIVIDNAKNDLKMAVVLTHVDNFESEWNELKPAEKAAHYVSSPFFFLTNKWPSSWSSAPIRGKEVHRMLHSKIVEAAVKQASNDTGIPISFIYPVANYSSEVETITEMNILHLYTLSKILDLAEEGAKFCLLSLSSSP